MAYSQPNACELNCAHDELTSYGYESELFVEPSKTIDFLCVICQHVAKRPRTHSQLADDVTCKVIFCSECLKSYIRHHDNSLTTSETQRYALCPFRCGANLIIRGVNRNITSIPKIVLNKLASLQMFCPFARGTVRYSKFENHLQNGQCECRGFTLNERLSLEKRVDSMLNRVCSEQYETDELILVRDFARFILDSLYPD